MPLVRVSNGGSFVLSVRLNAYKTGSGSVGFQDVFYNADGRIKSIKLTSGVGNLNGSAMTLGVNYDVSAFASITLSRGESSGSITSDFQFTIK